MVGTEFGKLSLEGCSLTLKEYGRTEHLISFNDLCKVTVQIIGRFLKCFFHKEGRKSLKSLPEKLEFDYPSIACNLLSVKRTQRMSKAGI